MKSKSKWHCIKDFTTERRRESDPAFMERNRELGRQKCYRKKERLGVETKSREKYDSENLMLPQSASE